MLSVEFLYFRDCPGREATLALLDRVLEEEGAAAEVVQIEVPGPDAAEEHRFVGSPSIRIDGVDLEGPEVEAAMGYGWRCRQYGEAEPGQTRAVPARELVRRRIRERIEELKANGG